MSEQQHSSTELSDVPTREIIVYGTGTICNSLIGIIYYLLIPITVLALGMNPILAGLIITIKTIWDGVTDPIMASITDNARTRWGRRRPFILVGGVLTIILAIATWAFIPAGDDVKLNTPVEKPSAIEQVVETDSSDVVEAAGSVIATAETVVADEAPLQEEVAEEVAPANEKKGYWDGIAEGFQKLKETSADHRRVFIFLTIMLLLLATTHTTFSVPYYALGIELAPSYHGRTRVVAYRSIFEKVQGLFTPWALSFCTMGVFLTPLVGMKWLMILVGAIALPAVLLSSIMTKERTQVSKDSKKVSIIRSMATTVKNVHFLKIAALYIVLQLSMGLFLQFGLFVNIFHVFGGDKESAMHFGAMMQGKVGSLGTVLAILSIPLITWMCKRFQKHNALRIALFTTGLGCILNWFCYTPANPNLQFILPFFFSLGISSTYTVLGTLFADVTDIDELNTGSRREGMFGAVMAWMSKAVGSIQGLAAGIILVSTGFVAGADSQTPETIFKMRLMFSFVPATVLFLSILILHRYPLNRERMEEIKEIIAKRKEEQGAEAIG